MKTSQPVTSLPLDESLRVSQLQRMLACSRVTILSLVDSPGFPRALRLRDGRGWRRWSRQQVEAWIARKRREGGRAQAE